MKEQNSYKIFQINPVVSGEMKNFKKVLTSQGK
jgi:hypothetical protein